VNALTSSLALTALLKKIVEPCETVRAAADG
jgi:hypothetical protein